MSTDTAHHQPHHHQEHQGSSRTPPLSLCVATLLTVKLLDGITTYVGQLMGYREVNPAVRWLIDAVGLEATAVWVALGPVILVAVAVEGVRLTVSRVAGRVTGSVPAWVPVLFRSVGFGAATIGFGAVGLWNCLLIAGA